ncbi:MAG: hypothetical protein HYX53_00500 [Chloroflexi bacterium]|nr:hypothetical protein [Chloroflexota bacterium]
MFGIDTIFGLPAHALLVHAAVVLVPLAVVLFAAACWRQAWRARYSLPIALLALGGAGFALLAKQTGGPLQQSIRQAAKAAGARASFGEHPEQGNTALVFAVFFALAAAAVWAIERYRSRYSLPKWAPAASYAIALVPAALALLTMLQAGHSGAQLVWKDVGTFAASR